MDQGLDRSITLPVVGRLDSSGSSATTAAGIRRIWPLEGWRNSARCRDSDPDVFYPLGRGRTALEQAEVAKAICRVCPSQEPCLTYALVTRQDLGVWGGTSPEDRRQILRARRRPAVAS